MAERKLLPWRKMWDFIGACEDAPDLRELLREAAAEFPRLISCEHAFSCRAELSPANTIAVSLEHSGAPEPAVRAYCERYFYEDVARLYMDRSTLTYQMDWREARFSDNVFVCDFIHGLLHIDFSAGIPIWDADGIGGVNIGFTRVGKGKMSSRDEAILLAVRPHLANLISLHKRLENMPADHLFAAELARESQLLSRREAEIAGLLCKRLHVQEIAERLTLSRRTVETHIQHIYNKLHVNSRIELLHRLMG
jgi:DNA-binding CsgD family transcriptional regulator